MDKSFYAPALNIALTVTTCDSQVTYSVPFAGPPLLNGQPLQIRPLPFGEPLGRRVDQPSGVLTFQRGIRGETNATD